MLKFRSSAQASIRAICLATTMLGACGGLMNASAEAADRPNILFIMSDDHGYQALSCYGSKVNQTPNLDRIAREGMRFDRCFVTNSICGPARAVLLTGKYSHLNGFVRNGNRFNGEQQHVGKLLQAAGYQTAVIGKWHLASVPTGFDYYHVLRGQGPYYNPKMLTSSGDVEHTGYTTEIITNETLDWLQERDDSKPFFLLYWHKAPHRNWQPGPDQLDHYDDVTIPEPATLYDDYQNRASPASEQTMTIAEHLTPYDLKLTPPRGLTEEQLETWNEAYGPKNEDFRKAELKGKELIQWKYQRYVKDYLRCVDAVDENVGRVLDYLDDSGLAENTIVVYSSDQGWYLGEHGWYDKRWMYEESFRTPLMIRWPGKVKPGSVNEDLVLNLDLPETFLEAAGVDIPDDMQGVSLEPLLAGDTPTDWRQSIYYHYYEFPGAHSVAKHYGIRSQRYKLIHYYDKKEWELFDLEKDPKELRSVYGESAYKEIQQELHDQLIDLRKQYQDDGQVVNFRAAEARNVKRKMVLKVAQDEPKVLTGASIQAMASSNENDPSNKPLTIGGWVKPEKDGILVAHGGESLGYAVSIKNGSVVFSVRNQGVLYEMTSGDVPLGEWTHIAAELNAEGMGAIRIRGEVIGQPQKLTLLDGRPADRFEIGADSGSSITGQAEPNGMHGEIRDVRVYWGTLGEKNWARWSR